MTSKAYSHSISLQAKIKDFFVHVNPDVILMTKRRCRFNLKGSGPNNKRLCHRYSSMRLNSTATVPWAADFLLCCTQIKINKNTVQAEKEPGVADPYYCLSDFVAPLQTRLNDYVGMFTVTCHGAAQLADKFEAELDDYSSIMVKAVADRLVEVFLFVEGTFSKTCAWFHQCFCKA